MKTEQSETFIEEFFVKNFNVDRIFDSIERADYLFLYYIKLCGEKSGEGSCVYLTTLAQEMKRTIPQVSRAVKKLQEKGYVDWNMNEEKDKTYVELTRTAVELMNDERRRMKEVYGRIREEVPQEELAQMVQTMKKVTAAVEREGK